MNMTDQEIIKALRCSATVHTEEVDCSGCPFYIEEEVPEDFFHDCDTDKIALAAADRLEELSHGMP